jgi:CBS domain-containing protein
MISKGTRLLVFKRESSSGTDKLHGIITASDIMRAFLETDRNPSLGTVISTRLVSLKPNNTILNAVKVMLKHRIGSVIVTGDEDERQGIFTERDLEYILQRNVDVEDNIGRYSSFPLVTAKLGIGASEVGRLMFANKIKRMPLIKNQKLVAIVTARDVVEAFQRRR